MPIYEYTCKTCGQEFEVIQKFSDPPLAACDCGEGGPVERKLSLSAFHLQGHGWYKDTYGNGKGSANGKGGANGNGSSSSTEASAGKDGPSGKDAPSGKAAESGSAAAPTA